MNIQSILSNGCRYTINIIWTDWVSIYLINWYICFWVSVLCEESFAIFFSYCLGDIFKIAIILFWQVRQHRPLFSLYTYSLWNIARRNHWYRRSFKSLKGLLIFCNFLLVVTNALGAKGTRFFCVSLFKSIKDDTMIDLILLAISSIQIWKTASNKSN